MTAQLQAKVRERGLELRPTLYAGTACYARLRRHMRLAALYKCCIFTVICLSLFKWQ